MPKDTLDDFLNQLALDDAMMMDDAASKPKATVKKGKKGKGKGKAVAEPEPELELAEDEKPTDVIIRGVGKISSDFKPLTTADGRVQTSPPTIPVSEFYTIFPEGEISDYGLDSTTTRKTAAEFKERELLNQEVYQELREAAQAHCQVRQDIQKYIRPGVALLDIANQLERSSKRLIGHHGIERGWGFPTGLSINNIAAHFSPNPGDKTILKENDVMKVDFGVHIHGRIIDCAFTAHFNPKYDPLVEAVQAATEAGIKTAGIDVRMADIGAAIQEVMESYEIDLDGRTSKIKCIRNLNGHLIAPYQIHSTKTVPTSDNGDQTKMAEGELYAIETFGSTGRGNIMEDGECSHYMRDFHVKRPVASAPGAVKLWNAIDKNFSTLAFCKRWLDDIGCKGHAVALRQLVNSGSVNAYPPLVEARGAYTAQYEHTILLRPTCKEVLTRSYDY